MRDTSNYTQWQQWLWPLIIGSVCAAVTLAFHRWPPATVTWPMGTGLHHATVFAALYTLLRWRFEAALAFSGALGISVAPLAVTGAPLGQYTLALAGEFSLLTSGAMMVGVIADYRFRRSILPLFPIWLWVLASCAGVVSVFPALGLDNWFPYFLGPNADWLSQAMATMAMVLALRRWYAAALIMVFVSVGYDLRLLTGHNAWAYAADWTWSLALIPVLRHRLRRRPFTQ